MSSPSRLVIVGKGISNSIEAVPAARATDSAKHVILKHERDDLVATVASDATWTGQFAFYLFRNGKRVHTQWYSSNPAMRFRIQREPGLYRVLAFFLAPNGSRLTKYSNPVFLYPQKFTLEPAATRTASSLQPRQVFRSNTRWGRSVLEWPSLDALLATGEVQSGIHSVPIGEFGGKPINYDFMLTARSGTVLLCHFHGNHPREGTELPNFTGLGVTSSIATSMFVPSDPVLVLDASLSLAWHFGCEGIRLQAITVRIVQKLQALLHAPRVVAWGGSGGGFAAIRVAKDVPNSIALVWNPQTDIAKYCPESVARYRSIAFPSNAADGPISSDGEQFPSLCTEAFRAGYQGRILYLQERTDLDHVDAHLKPFLDSFCATPLSSIMNSAKLSGFVTDQLFLHIGHWADGHIPPSKDVLAKLLGVLSDATIKVDDLVDLDCFPREVPENASSKGSQASTVSRTGIGNGREPEIVNVNKLREIVRYGDHADLLNSDLSRDIETLRREFAQPTDLNHIHKYRDRYYLFIELIRFTEGLNAAIKWIEQDLADGMNYRIYTSAGATAYRRENRYDEELHFLRKAYTTYKLDPSIARSYAASLLSNNFPEDAAPILLRSIDKITSAAQALPALVLIANTCQWNVLREGLKYVTDILRRGDSTIAAGTLETLEERLRQSSTDKKRNIPLLSISLERDRRKRELQRKLYSFCGLEVEFLNGVLGSTLPRIVETFLCQGGFLSGSSKGAIGCALSHIRAWEFMTEKKYEYAVILEDDGTPHYGFNPETLINDSGSDFDILLINQRMSSLIGPHTDYKYVGCVNVSERLRQMPDAQKGWGGDGYILSHNGAKQLLRCISVDGILGHIDGQLSSYGYDAQIVAQSRAQVTAATFMAGSKSTDRLNVKCLNFPAVHQMNFDYSSRIEESRK